MQPGTNPDDLHTIMSRFQTWAEKQPISSNGNHHKNGIGSEEVREIPYEEALRQYRKRRAPQGRRAAQPSGADRDTTAEPESTVKIAAQAQAVVEQKAPVSAAPFCVPEMTTPAATALPQMDVAAIMPSATAPAPNPPLKAKDPVERIAKPKKAPKPKATDARQKSAVNKPAIQVCQPTEENVAIAAIKPVATPANQAKPLTRRPGVAKSAIQPKPQSKNQAASAAVAVKKHAATPSAEPRRKKHPAFRQILASSVRSKPLQATKVRVPKKQAAPDRNRRITTRFSSVEQRSIERQAAAAGLTVSAWLRHCALAQARAQIHPQSTLPAKHTDRKARSMPPAAPSATLFSQPSNSLLGNWLTLLRQRFLASPERFAERA